MRGIPSKGSNATALGSIDGNFTSARFEYRDTAGIVIGSLDLANGGGNVEDPVASNIFYGNVTVPGSDFTLYLVGKDSTGAAFQRVLPATFIYPAHNGSSNGTTTNSSSISSVTWSSATLPSYSSYTNVPSSSPVVTTESEECHTTTTGWPRW